MANNRVLAIIFHFFNVGEIYSLMNKLFNKMLKGMTNFIKII